MIGLDWNPWKPELRSVKLAESTATMNIEELIEALTRTVMVQAVNNESLHSSVWELHASTAELCATTTELRQTATLHEFHIESLHASA